MSAIAMQIHALFLVGVGVVVTFAIALGLLEWAFEKLLRSWRHWPALLEAYLAVRRHRNPKKGIKP